MKGRNIQYEVVISCEGDIQDRMLLAGKEFYVSTFGDLSSLSQIRQKTLRSKMEETVRKNPDATCINLRLYRSGFIEKEITV